jgi:hypothetical protein
MRTLAWQLTEADNIFQMVVVINNDMSALSVENYQMLRIVVSTAVV